MAEHNVAANGNYPSDAGMVFDHMLGFDLEAPAGATVKLEISADGTTWLDVPNGSFTTATSKNLIPSSRRKLRANVSGYATAFKMWF
jgi:hypothetical protein